MKEPYSGFDKDAETVKQLAEHHLGHHAYPHGLRPSDIELNESLLGCGVELPQGNNPSDWLSMKNVKVVLTNACGRAVPENYAKKFFNEAYRKHMRRERPITVGDVARAIKRIAETEA